MGKQGENLTREDRIRGGSRWTPAKEATVGRAFQEKNRAEAERRIRSTAGLYRLYQDGWTLEELAEFTGRKVNGVKQAIQRAKRDMPTLNQLVEGEDPIDYECPRPSCLAPAGTPCQGRREHYTCMDSYHRERRQALYAAVLKRFEESK